MVRTDMATMAKYKVAFVIGKMVGGGQESVILDVLEGIDSNEFQVDLIIDADSTYVPYNRITKLNIRLCEVTPYQQVFGFVRDLDRIFKNQNYGLKHSYSLKGHPYDNGRMEAFHSILKREEEYLKAYQTLTEVQAAIGWDINFYNRNRISNVA
ncbi:hypothetical protein EFL93_10980 [Weissella confusa]|nr:hypothetical protein [Weissella confusa]